MHKTANVLNKVALSVQSDIKKEPARGLAFAGPWRSLEQVEFATLEWVDWFNNKRLLEPIGNIPPAEAEARYYAQIEEPAMAASFKRNGLRQTRDGSVFTN